MHHNNDPEPTLKNYRLDIRIIGIAILSIVLTLLLIYFIRIYTNKKYSILSTLNIEATNLDKVFATDINYSQCFLTLIAMDLKYSPKNPRFIQHVFDNHANSASPGSINNLFGGRKYSWINSHYQEVITNVKDQRQNPDVIKYIESTIPSAAKNQINYYASNASVKIRSLNLIYNIFELSTGEYNGSIILSYNIPKITRGLQSRTGNKYTRFVILDENFKIILQSRSTIKNIIDQDERLSPDLKSTLKNIDFTTENYKPVTYLDILQGVNYHINKVENLPFIIITNLDSQHITRSIIGELVKKFVEVGFFGITLFLGIVSIYKKETILRAKAEKATAIANKATKAKSEFLAFTAHEIRSPLGFIVTGAEVMSKELLGTVPDVYKSYVQGIHQNSIMILEFIKDILDESKIIEGKFKITNSIINVTEIIEEAIVVNKARFTERKVAIYTHLEKNLPSLIGDKRRLLQVMNNLISNAIKYSKDNTKIIVSTVLVTSGLKISIEDEGIGMSKSEVKNIMDGVNMTVKNSHDNIESYGLGLVIVKMLLEAHDAKFKIVSKLHSGTTVKITFPYHKLVFD